MTKYPLFTYSTAHIPFNDSLRLDLSDDGLDRRLREMEPCNVGLIAPTDYGWLFWVGSEGPYDNTEVEFAKAGFSLAIPKVLRHAHQQADGCMTYVLFDSDEQVDPADGLPHFDW